MFDDVLNFIRSIYGEEKSIPLHRPIFVGNEKQYLNECIDSSYVSSVGKFVERFEENIVKRILQTEWWLMEDSQIDDLSKYLLSSDTEKFFSSIREIKENK